MTFPTPQVAGVFLKLPRRVEDAIRRGTVLSSNDGASRYLMNGAPRRLRNNVGFHAAIAEFVDALLERAVLPYQITPTLPSLSVLPDADVRGSLNPQGGGASVWLDVPVPMPSALATAELRAALGAEKRFAPAEFWRSMIAGSDALGRNLVLFGYPRDAPGGYDIMVYPASFWPFQAKLEGMRGEGGPTAALGFHDVDDTGWVEDSVDFPGHWLPANHAQWIPAWETGPRAHRNPLETEDDLGRATLEVFAMLDYPQDWSGCSSYSMLLRLGDFDGSPWPWGGYVDHQYLASGVPMHGGFNFAAAGALLRGWGRGMYACPEWPPDILLLPYFCDYVGDLNFPDLKSAAVAAYGVRTRLHIACERGYEDPESLAGPWISPTFYRQIATTPRPNLDILRVQQALLAAMRANWARMLVDFSIPHEYTTHTHYFYVDNRTGEILDSSHTVASSTHGYFQNTMRWEHSATTLDAGPDGGEVCCGACFTYDLELDDGFGDGSGDGSDSGSGYPPCPEYLLDEFARQDEQGWDDAIREAQRAKAAAEAAKTAAEADMASAEAAWNGLKSAFAANFASTPDIDHWVDGATPDAWTGHIYYDAFCDTRSDEIAFSNILYAYAYTDSNDRLDTLSTAGNIMELLWTSIIGGDTDPDWAPVYSGLKDGSVTTLRVVRNGLSVSLPADAVSAVSRFIQARDARDQAEADIAAAAVLADGGVCYDVSSTALDLLLRGHGHCTEQIDTCPSPADPVIAAVLDFLVDNPGYEGTVTGWDPPFNPFEFVIQTRCRRPDPSASFPFKATYKCRLRASGTPESSDNVPFWPAASLVTDGYVDEETVALGLTVHDHDVHGYYAPGTALGPDDVVEYEAVRDPDDIPDAEYKRIAINTQNGQIELGTPTKLAMDLLMPSPISPDPPGLGIYDAHMSPGDLGDVFDATNRLGMLPPLFVTHPMGQPIVHSQVMSVRACYHPDKSPTWTTRAPFTCDGRRYPFRIVAEICAPDGVTATYTCELDGGDSALRFGIGYDICYSPASVDCAQDVDEGVSVSVKPAMALRARWGWKSMPVN